MFLQNDHCLEYYRIIKERSVPLNSDVYYETHHIIPKSLGGTDNSDNLVRLLPQDHYIVHQLLTKITTGEDNTKMWCALWRMMNPQSYQQRDFTIDPADYAAVRTKFAVLQSFRMKGSNNPFYGRKHSEETKQKMRLAKKGKTLKELYGAEREAEMLENRRKARLGKKHTEESKARMRKPKPPRAKPTSS